MIAIQLLTPHPQIPNIQRTIELIGLNFSESDKVCTTTNLVKHYVVNGDTNYIPELDKTISLIADNTEKIQISESELVGDFDYIFNSTEDGIPMKVIYENIISFCEQSGKIDQKCQYK